MKLNEDNAKIICKRADCSVEAPQCEERFMIRMSIIFLLLGAVLLVAMLLSEYYWTWQFERLYGLGGEMLNVTKATDIQDYQALKPLLNLTMYAIPKTLGFIGTGFALIGTTIIVGMRPSTGCRRYSQRKQYTQTES